MEGKYIFAIIILGLFFLLILVSFAFLEYGRKNEEKLQAWIRERYEDKELNKYDYDTVNSDEDFLARSVQSPVAEVNSAVEENREDTVPAVPDEAYDKIDVEGIEEITGNYDGGK